MNDYSLPRTTTGRDDDESASHRTSSHRATTGNGTVVELATLILPAHAVHQGLEAGEGDQVVLEALPSTVEHLVSDLQHQAEQVGEGQTHEQSQHNQILSQISAVVNLEVLSELVGISEQEFIADLHADANDHREQQQQLEAQANTENNREADEETPLLPTVGGATTGIDAPSVNSSDNITAKITLQADAFIETLAEALPSMPEETEQDLKKANSIFSQTGSVATVDSTPDNWPTIHTGVTEAAATKTTDENGDAQQHLGHDAFLLHIPHYEGIDGEMRDHFVLALPEILAEASLANQTQESQLSMESVTGVTILERAMSYLPTDLHLPNDVQAVHLEAHQDTPSDPQKEGALHLELVVQHQVPVIGYVILISGLVALASVGAALDLQHGPSPTIKTLWRQLCTSMVLFPLVLKSLFGKDGDGFPELTRSQWLQLMLCGMAYAYMCLAFVAALEMTTMANAFVLSNMTSLVIIAGRFVLGLPILPLEGYGAIIGFVGAGICANDASRTMAKAAALMAASVVAAQAHGAGPSDAMLGNIIALSASFGTACYLIVAKNLRSSMDLFVFMFSVMMLGSCWLVLYMLIMGFQREPLTFDMHPDYGLFGWLNTTPDRLPLELYMAIICNCLGTTGYIAVMKYFDPIVPATVMLMEPVVGALLGVAAGTAKLPGTQTWLGDLVVAAGTSS